LTATQKTPPTCFERELERSKRKWPFPPIQTHIHSFLPIFVIFANIFSLCLFSIFSLLARQLPSMQLLSRQMKYYEINAEKKRAKFHYFPSPAGAICAAATEPASSRSHFTREASA